MTQRRIPMGAGLLPPQHAVEASRAAHEYEPRQDLRRLLGALAVGSPVLFGLFIAVDPGPLPRAPAAEFLGAIADAPGMYVAATCIQIASMICGLALAVTVGLAFRDSSRRLSAVAGATMAVGYLGGTGFAGAKLVAADLVVDGELRPDATEIWTAVQNGPFFQVMTVPLVMAVLGTLLVTIVLARARRTVSWWPAALMLLGSVMGSGEFPDIVTHLGPFVQVPAVAVMARQLVRVR